MRVCVAILYGWMSEQRFEHKTSTKSVPQKIDTPVRFPASLNMAPYTTLAMNQAGNVKDGYGSTCVPTGDHDTDTDIDTHAYRYPGPEAMYEYDLFAVINHEGRMDNGHYTNFARFRDEVRLFLPFYFILGY